MKITRTKIVGFLFISCLFSKLSVAQTEDSLLNQLSNKWMNAKVYMLKMAETMPAENFHFKPTPEIMSFQEQLLHLANNMIWLSSTYLFADTTKMVRKPSALDKATVVKYVNEAYDLVC